MNPTVDNDLQKAIDDITKTTNQDPVFADPVAAPSSVPEGDSGELAESVGPFPTPEPIAPTPVPVSAPAPEPVAPVMPATPAPAPAPEMPVPEPIISETIVATEVSAPENLNSMREVKAAALRDLAPLVSKMDLSASQKFNLYRDMFENLRDYTAIEPAYQAAKNIVDETERGEALLYLINSIDKM